MEYSEITDWGQIFQDFHPQGWYGYIKDHVGTIYKVWDHNAKSVADNRTYDSFGNLVSQTGTTKTPLGFQGKYYDQESGLNYFYHRYYNPTIGRFISEDPIGYFGSHDFYNFVYNSPLNNIDPYGLATFKNNCNHPVPYKPEKTCGECKENLKYECPPGATCDVDGVYPANGGNPFKIADGCEAECKGGKLFVICRSIVSRVYQNLFGGQKSDRWMNKEKNRNWPRPTDPTFPPCKTNK
jgi:RHS repeat-associated protein